MVTGALATLQSKGKSPFPGSASAHDQAFVNLNLLQPATLYASHSP